jgi:hypothetical protein
MKKGLMNYLFLMVLLTAVLMTAGCLGENHNTDATPTQTINPSTTVPIPVPTATRIQVSLHFIEGSTGGCVSDPEKKFYTICLDDEINVSVRNNTVSTSGSVFFTTLTPKTSWNEEERSYYDRLKGVYGSARLAIFNNKTLKVAEVSKTFSVARNGKIPIYFDTEIPESIPADLTYTLSLENIHPEMLPATAVPAPTPYQECAIDSHQRYRTSRSEWLVFGTVSNSGTLGGNCRVNVQLIAFDGSYLDNRDQIVYVAGEGNAPFSITLNEPGDEPGAYYKIFVYNQDIT